MDEDTINDLKQFITTVISQQTSDLVERIDSVNNKVDVVDKKIDNLSQSVAEALDAGSEANDTQYKDYGERISKLEQKVV